jgi:hypothetical protein
MKFFTILTVLLLVASQSFAQALEHQLLSRREEAGTVLLRTKIQSPLQNSDKGQGLKFKSPVPFTSLALVWKTNQQTLNPSAFAVHYRVHHPEIGWRKWATEEGAYSPADHGLGDYYTTDLLFGIDEKQHDSIEFYLETPQGVLLQEVQLVLQDMSGHQINSIIDNGTAKSIASSCPAQPVMIQRSGWCGSYTACLTPTYTPSYITTPTHTVIHHGASPDTYTDGYAVVRSYWNYHVNTLAWSDIGYNYLFDKNGNMFVGRHNPNFPASDVRGAHAGSSNSNSIGLSFLGNADIAGNVPQATLNLATNFIAWWYNLRGLNPTTSANIINQAGTITINLSRICGHKDLNPTACPGVLLYNYLPTFRSNAQQIITNCQSVVAPTLSVSAGCATGSVTLNVTVSANQTFQLLNSTGTTVLQSWTGTATTYTFIGLATGTYTGKVIRNSVTSALSSAATLTNRTATVGGTISGTSGICLGSATGTMTLSGHIGSIVRWEKKLRTSTTWTNITNTTASYSETPAFAAVWDYRALVQDGSCASVYSNTFSITVSAASTGGTLAGTTTAVCLGTASGTISLSGHIGTIIRWEKRLNTGTWANIANTTTTYSETPTSAGSWQYRALVQNGTCASTYSTVFSKTFNSSVAGTLSGTAGAVCLGTSTGTITLSGNTGSVIRWEKRVNAGTWANITSTAITYSETPSTAGTWEYRALVQNSPCASAYSSVFSKTVQATSLGGTLSGTLPNVCAAQSTGTITLSGQRGTVLRWEKRLNAGTWTTISSTATTYSEIPTSAGTWEYRALVQNSPCASVYSSTYTVNATTNAIGSFCHCPIQLTLPVVNYQGNTASFADNYNPADVTPSFTGLEANDAVFRFTLTSRSIVTANLTVSGIWGGMLLTTNCPNPTVPTTYINSYQQWNGGTMTTTLDPGTYMLLVSSNSQWTATMPFTLNISTAPALRSDDNNSLLEISNTALNLSVYPNPASDFINIICSSIPQTTRIINANGNLVLEQYNLTSTQITMPVHQLQTGLYFIQAIGSDGTIESVSFIINN